MTDNLDASPDALAKYLASNPSMTPRDFKGKGFHAFRPFDPRAFNANEVPWDRLDREAVRKLAIREKARFLPHNVRQAAARDPGLTFNERTRSYELAPGTPLHPSPPTGHDDLRGTGLSKVSKATHSGPAATPNSYANTENRR